MFCQNPGVGHPLVLRGKRKKRRAGTPAPGGSNFGMGEKCDVTHVGSFSARVFFAARPPFSRHELPAAVPGTSNP
eukprot:3721843-Rhodomonas_salina.1